MARSETDDAIVLRVHNVGETDRFCVLLTRAHGRMTARAQGARKTTSTRGRGLLPFHRITVTWEARSAGNMISAVKCLDAYDDVWRDPQSFSAASRAIELVLKLTDDGLPLPEVYDLAAEFLSGCTGPDAETRSSVFALGLLAELGYLPSSTLPVRASPILTNFLLARSFPLDRLPKDPALAAELPQFVASLLGSQLGVSLASPGVSLADPMPICHVSGRAS